MTGVPPAGPVIRRLGLCHYETVWRNMQRFALQRSDDTADELWMLQHHPVYTLGLNCGMDPLEPSAVPVVKTDRGGQITYHGPGQVIAYLLIDVKRRRTGVRGLVGLMEQAVIDLLGDYGIEAERRDKAPGVYVDGRKIAALGIRIRRGSSYHGLSLNVDMDLAPFANIHPCGYEGLEVTQLADLGVADSPAIVEGKLAARLLALLQGH